MKENYHSDETWQIYGVLLLLLFPGISSVVPSVKWVDLIYGRLYEESVISAIERHWMVCSQR